MKEPSSEARSAPQASEDGSTRLCRGRAPLISRRAMLRGVLGGAAVGIGLPALDVFLNGHGDAWADGTALPRRFGIWFWGNGNHPERWAPAATGATWELSEQLMPLAPVKDEVTIVSGLNVKTGNSIPHWSGPAGLLSGAPLIVKGSEDYTFAAPTIDQLVAAELGRDTRFRSIECGAAPQAGISYNGPESRNPAEGSPRRLFARVFGGGFQAPGAEPIVDPRLALRRSVLDAVTEDARRLKSRVGKNDQERLDRHLSGVRELERRIARLEEDPPNLESCAVPMEPGELPDVDGRPQLSARNRAVCDILAMALACDQTRVFTNVFSYPVNNNLFPDSPAGHHRLTHDEPGDQPEVNRIIKLCIAELAYQIQALKNVPEGAGTLLDNTLLLGTSCVSFGRNHSLDDYPIVLAGTACGALKKGLHYRSASGENTSKLGLSILRAMGVRAAEFGTGPGKVSDGISAIET